MQQGPNLSLFSADKTEESTELIYSRTVGPTKVVWVPNIAVTELTNAFRQTNNKNTIQVTKIVLG